MVGAAAPDFFSSLPAIDWDRLEVVDLSRVNQIDSHALTIELVAPLLFNKLRLRLKRVLLRLSLPLIAEDIPTDLKIKIRMSGIETSAGTFLSDYGGVSTLVFANGLPIVSHITVERIQREGRCAVYKLSLDSDEGSLELTANEANMEWVKVQA